MRVIPPTSQIGYTGPVSLGTKEGDNSTIVTNLAGIQSVATTSGGAIAVSYTTDGVVALPEWSTWVNLYREYRVLGIEVEYRPQYTPSFPAPSLIAGFGATAIIHGSSASQTPVQLVENSTYQTWNPGMYFKRAWKMANPEEAHFLQTTVTVNNGGVFVGAANATASVTLGQAYVRYLIQFKTRT